MKVIRIVTITGTVLLASCGTEQQKASPAPQEKTTQPTEQQSLAGLPEGAIIAVPVDAQGQELTEQAQMRLLPESPGAVSGAGIATNYNLGKQPDHVSDELDQNSSTESYRGWHNYRHFNNYGGRYNRYGYGPRGQQYGHCNYRAYQPTYYSSGVPYNWQYQQSYQTSSMNYYYYNRSQTQGQYPDSAPYSQPGQQQQFPDQQQVPYNPQQQQIPGQQYPNPVGY